MKQLLPAQITKGDNASAIVLLHGLGNNHKSWTYVLKALDKKHQVIAPDLLGFGSAPKPKGDYAPRDHANAVITLLDSLKVKNAVVAGHSMGCIVAIEIAKQRPDLASRLVLLGAPLYRRKPRKMWWAKFLHFESAYFTIFTILKKNPTMTITAAKSADLLLPLLKGMEITEETWPAFRASLNNTIMQIKSYQDVRKLKTPTLLMYGKLDIFVIKRNLTRLARKNKQYVRCETVLGPHEITPLQGKKVAELLA